MSAPASAPPADLSMHRVLVTGGTTPVGHALVGRLLADPRVERVLVVGREPRRTSLELDGRLAYHRADLARERSIRSLVFGPVRDEGVTTIVHMAAHRGVVEGPRAHALHVQGPRRLLHFAERVPTVRRFVYRSYGSIYARGGHLPVRIDEDHPLRIGRDTPQYVLDRVEADLAVCARMGMSRVAIAVLRCAECLAPGAGSQLFDYLRSRVCFRPLGFDPMINVISAADLADALARAALADAEGIFTIPGHDTLPLSRIIARFGRAEVPIPGPVLRPLYRLRRAVLGSDFHPDVSRGRLTFGGVLDGERAAAVLGYVPSHPVRWPLRLEEISRSAQVRNPRSLRGRAERWLDRPG